MEQMIIEPEDEIIEKLTLKGYISQFDPEIQSVFFNAYGKNPEAIPHELLQSNLSMERFLECLLMMNDTKAQMVILMRFGFVYGKPMTLQEIGDAFGITRERVRQIESMFRRKLHPHAKRMKRISDFYVE